MAQPTIVQTVGNATTVATPASIVGTYAATGVGSLLVAVVAVAPSAAPAVATPAGWTAGPSVSSSALGIFYFYLPNNAGAITAVTFTLTNANGAGVTMYEISGMQLATGLDLNTFSAIASSTTVGAVTGNTLVNDEAVIAASAFITASVLTQALTPATGVWTAATLQTSTTGATNVALQAYVGKPGTIRPIGVGGTLSVGQQNASGMVSFLSTSSTQATIVVAEGVAGQWVPGAYSGSIGGQ